MIKPLNVMVQSVLPLVYDSSLSYYEVLAKVADKCNELIASNNEMASTIENLPSLITEGALEIFTPEYISTIITEEYLNSWLSANEIITGLQRTSSANSAHVLENTLAIQGLNNRVSSVENDILHLPYEINSYGANYIKFENGLAIVWGQAELANIEFTTEVKHLIVSDFAPFPFVFNTVYSCVATMGTQGGTSTGDYAALMRVNYSTQGITHLVMYRPTTGTFTLYLNYTVIGRWK